MPNIIIDFTTTKVLVRKYGSKEKTGPYSIEIKRSYMSNASSGYSFIKAHNLGLIQGDCIFEIESNRIHKVVGDFGNEIRGQYNREQNVLDGIYNVIKSDGSLDPISYILKCLFDVSIDYKGIKLNYENSFIPQIGYTNKNNIWIIDGPKLAVSLLSEEFMAIDDNDIKHILMLFSDKIFFFANVFKDIIEILKKNRSIYFEDIRKELVISEGDEIRKSIKIACHDKGQIYYENKINEMERDKSRLINLDFLVYDATRGGPVTSYKLEDIMDDNRSRLFKERIQEISNIYIHFSNK